MFPVFMIFMAATGALEGAKFLMQSKSAEAQERALNLQAEENTLQYQQKTLSNLDLTERVIQRQMAEATTRGIALTSPSFGAIQREALNVGVKQQAATTQEFSFLKQNIETEKRNVKTRLYAQLFGDIEEFGSMAFSAKRAMPQKG